MKHFFCCRRRWRQRCRNPIWSHNCSFRSRFNSAPPSPCYPCLHLQTARGKTKVSSRGETRRRKPSVWRLLRPRPKDGGWGHQRLLLLRLWTSWNKLDNRQQFLLWIENFCPLNSFYKIHYPIRWASRKSRADLIKWIASPAGSRFSSLR